MSNCFFVIALEETLGTKLSIKLSNFYTLDSEGSECKAQSCHLPASLDVMFAL